MSEESDNKKEPWWKILAALTPLILGLGITSVYNKQQTRISELTLMDKFKRDLISENPIDSEFAYAAFVALGYKDIADDLMDSLPHQIFIQTTDEKQKNEEAKIIRSHLRELGYSVPPIENIKPSDLPDISEVRYFFKQDERLANRIVKALKCSESLKKIVKPTFISRNEKEVQAKKGNVEIWFAK